MGEVESRTAAAREETRVAVGEGGGVAYMP